MPRFLSSFALLCFVFPALGFDPSSQDDSLALARHFKRPVTAPEPFLDGTFLPKTGETVTLMGGADLFRMQEYGYLEAAVMLAFPDRKLRIRNIAWPADTVYRQQRPMFFYTEKGDSKEGSIPDTRERIEPGVFILQFGKMESLDGVEALPEFVRAYENLLKELSRFSPRLVLVSPLEFSREGPAGSLADERNEVLRQYSRAIQEMASKRGIPYWEVNGDPDTSGRLQTQDDFRKLAKVWSLQHFVTIQSAEASSGQEVEGDALDRVAEKVRWKNKLWNQYYRPTNWAFLFGDRQHVPSSRDHRDANRRWFVEELEKLPPLIEKADQAIWEEASK